MFTAGYLFVLYSVFSPGNRPNIRLIEISGPCPRLATELAVVDHVEVAPVRALNMEFHSLRAIVPSIKSFSRLCM